MLDKNKDDQLSEMGKRTTPEAKNEDVVIPDEKKVEPEKKPKKVSKKKDLPVKPKLRRRVKSPPLPTKFFVMSVDADRAIVGVCLCPKGKWVQVSRIIYDGYLVAVNEGKRLGEKVGWRVRCE